MNDTVLVICGWNDFGQLTILQTSGRVGGGRGLQTAIQGSALLLCHVKSSQSKATTCATPTSERQLRARPSTAGREKIAEGAVVGGGGGGEVVEVGSG